MTLTHSEITALGVDVFESVSRVGLVGAKNLAHSRIRYTSGGHWVTVARAAVLACKAETD